MKRRGVAMIVGVVVLGLALSATACISSGDGDSSDDGSDLRTITVSGTATAEQAPDQAIINLSVQAQADDSAKALSDSAEQMQAVLDAIKGEGVEEQDIRTTNVSVSRRVVDRRTPQERSVFVASNSIEVTVKDLDTVGDVIDAAVGAGATGVRGVRFTLSDPDQVQADALAQAVQSARNQADALAEASGAEVVGVVSIDDQSGGGGNQPGVFEAISRGSLTQADAYAPPVVAPDSLKTNVSVQVVWEIDS
jgi:uncharacterized protein YggE